MIDAADFVAVEIPEPTQIIHGILHKGARMILGGGSKTCKTWVLLDLALSVSHGIPWLSFPVTRGRVLFVNLELQPFGLQRRLKKVSRIKFDEAWLESSEIQKGWLTILNLRGYAASFETMIPELISKIGNREFDLVILDPFYKLLGGGSDENSSACMTQIMNSFEEISMRVKCALVISAHFSKGNQSSKFSGDRVSGSGVLLRDPDAMLTMTAHKEDGAFAIEAILREMPPVQSFVVRWEYPLMRLDSSLDASTLKEPDNQTKKAKATAGDVLALFPPDGSGITAAALSELASTNLEMGKRTLEGHRARLSADNKIHLSKTDNLWRKILPKK